MTVTTEKPKQVGWFDKMLGRDRVRQKMDFEGVLRRLLMLLFAGGLYVFLLYPLYKILIRSLSSKAGEFVGLSNYVSYFSSASSAASKNSGNSQWVWCRT